MAAYLLIDVKAKTVPGEILDFVETRKKHITFASISSRLNGVHMNKLVLSLSLAVAQMLAVSAFAQTKGEADPAQSKAIPSAPATAAEKAEAKKARKAEGAAVAKSKKTTADADPSSLGKAKATTKAERKAAAAKRKAELAPAVKKGEISSGEK
jgi:hypothetical protein